jgi:hypothetical protein
VSFLADGRSGRTGHDLADQYMAALPAGTRTAEDLEAYAYWVKLAGRAGISQMEIDYIRRKCVIIALETAYERGELARNWRMEH